MSTLPSFARRWSVLFSLLAVAGAGCDSGGGGIAPGTDAGNAEGADAGAPFVGEDAGPGTEQDGSAGGASDAGRDLGPAPTLVSVEMREIGRFGGDLQLVIAGDDLDRNVASARIRVRDGSGADVLLFDSDADGSADSASEDFPLDMLPSGDATTFRATVTLPRFVHDHAAVRAAAVSVVDAHGQASAALEAVLVPQVEVNEGLECDPTFARNRCASGLACRAGTPSVCVAGSPPTLDTVAYYVDAATSRVLVLGADVDDDVATVHLEFLDATDSPVMLDLDGDSIDESSEFDADAAGTGTGGAYFVSIENGASFGELVAKVAITARDRGGRSSERRIVARQATPTRRVGESCDPRGFNACASGACVQAMPSRPYTCVSLDTARASACTAAAPIALVDGHASVSGMTARPSLWNAPAGCSTNDPVSRPEAMVHLRFASAQHTVRLSTDNAFTNFDTTVYVIAGCRAAPTLAWCSDDTPASMRTWASTLELHDVPAGDYFVIVDSFSDAGGRFTLDVDVE